MHILICCVCGEVVDDAVLSHDSIASCTDCAMVHGIENTRKHECYWCGNTIDDDVVDCGKRKYHTDCYEIDMI